MAMADRLWTTGPARRLPRAPISFSIDTDDRAVSSSNPLAEEWSVGVDDVEFALSDALEGRIACRRGQLTARVAASLVDANPSLVARMLLETPAAVLLARRAYAVVHAGAVTGPGGAVVIRGAPGAGKSTLVAAAHRAGLGVMGDETVLVAREYPDELVAAVRDVTLLPDAAQLLALKETLQPAGNTREEKLRLDLFAASQPDQRWARRVATVVIGSRNGGPARLEALEPASFLEEFERGQIAQEHWSGTPDSIAKYWAARGAYRLAGAADLDGAVALLAEMVA